MSMTDQLGPQSLDARERIPAMIQSPELSRAGKGLGWSHSAFVSLSKEPRRMDGNVESRNMSRCRGVLQGRIQSGILGTQLIG